MIERISRLVVGIQVILFAFLPAHGADVKFLPQPKVVASSPAYAGNYVVENLFDNNPATEYCSASAGTKTFIDVDFGVPTVVGGFMHMDRRDGISQIHGASLTLSDRADFSAPSATLALQAVPGGTTWQTFPPVTARYARWQVTSLGSVQTVGGAEMAFLPPGQEEAVRQLSSGQNDKAIYVSDMSTCRPAKALSTKLTPHTWQLITYECGVTKGTLASAFSFVNAPDLTVPLGVSGWYAVYLGYWNFYGAYDGAHMLKARLSDAPAFRQFLEASTTENLNTSQLREVFFDYADLTGRDLVVGKSNGLISRRAALAYVKLVPLSAEEIAKIQADRADRSTRKLVATIDGISYFWQAECSKPSQVLELIELYRNSDVGKVLWAVNYGSETNYRTKVKEAAWVPKGCTGRALLGEARNLHNDYVRGERQCAEALLGFDAKGIVPQQVAAEHAHAMGLRFDLMFRIGMTGGIPGGIHAPDNYVNRHPECSLVLREREAVAVASYAFPQVRRLMLDIIAEAMGKIDADGANLCLTRGPHAPEYEAPVCEAFQKKYGEDARKVDPGDPRLRAVRGEFMTAFLRETRQTLDRIGERKGKRLELSVWIGGYPAAGDVFDVKAWIREGLLDTVIAHSGQGFDEEYKELGKSQHCTFIRATGADPAAAVAGFQAGVDGFAVWDIDAAQINAETWDLLRRLGHPEMMANWNQFAHLTKSIPITKMNGRNLTGNSLMLSVYSGG
jgi:hypothetical protein